jgi:hypothetical protein
VLLDWDLEQGASGRRDSSGKKREKLKMHMTRKFGNSKGPLKIKGKAFTGMRAGVRTSSLNSTQQ